MRRSHLVALLGLAAVSAPAVAQQEVSATNKHCWGENVGWINLNDTAVFVEFVGGCAADYNGDGAVNSNDISAFLTDWLAAVNGGCN